MARFRGQLFVCATGCCCGRTDDGFAAVPTELYHGEWERRRLRNVVHLTIGGCLGPCALANVALLLFDGQAQWFHSIDSEALVRALYDHIDAMLAADGCLPAAARAGAESLHGVGMAAAAGRPARGRLPASPSRGERSNGHGQEPPATDVTCHEPDTVECRCMPRDGRGLPRRRRRADSGGRDRDATARAAGRPRRGDAVPRRNGELVFDEPWQGRVFGMAVALSEQGLLPWEEFRQALIAEIAAAEARGGEFRYYHAWLAAFERVLAARGAVRPDELEETTFQFEFGERDEVY